MKKIYKWIIGVVVVLLVLGVIAGAGYLAIHRWGGTNWMMGTRSFQPWNDERNGRGFDMPMMRGGRYPGGWFGGFFPLGMIFGGLFWAGVIFLCVVGIVSLFRGRKTGRPAAATVAQVTPAAAVGPTSEPAPISTQTGAIPVESAGLTPAHTCSNCGHAVQEDWSHCPYCGQQLK